MNKVLSILVVVVLLASCKKTEEKTAIPEVEGPKTTYVSFGKEILADNAISAGAIAEQYDAMKEGDSVNSKIIATVNEVCQAKGCWMKLDLENGKQVMVKFKDYGFFMPKNIAGKDVVINGKAFVDEVSVEEQRHYAEDAKMTTEDIEKITEPKKTFSFEADGVLLVEN